MQTSIISHAWILLSQARKNASICWWQVTNRYKKYDAGCTITPLATKTRKYFHQTDCHHRLGQDFYSSFCKTHILQLEEWWSNIFDASYKILFIQYLEEPFLQQNTLCLVQNKCLFFVFRNMCYSRFIGKDWFKLKTSVKFLKFQNSIVGLSLNIFSITCHSKNAWRVQSKWVCVLSKYFDNCYNTLLLKAVCYSNYQNLWKRTQILVVRWKNVLLWHVSFILVHLMIAAPLKAQAIMPHLLLFFSKYFLHCQQLVYWGCYIY